MAEDLEKLSRGLAARSVEGGAKQWPLWHCDASTRLYRDRSFIEPAKFEADRPVTHGYAETLEAATQAFASNWFGADW